ncbi:restriction endonuclease subunit S [Aeromonas caviae]|uniref:restriction endonuclease subunit S n=1 Tax=Aeromonas caviae TaxID=648 RepID=UPI002E7B8993|nr:restriction endonuclease subunit S [Aeromonas caviae]MEE1911938.1 restriction endonuclease subunit S [Aeromonas caviae]
MSEVVDAAQQGLAGKYKPYPEYKDSGDYWFGQLPAHWQLSKLKYVTSIYGRIGFRGYTVNDIVSEGEGALVLSPSNVIGDVLDLEKKTYLSWGKYYESPEIMVASGDILIVKTGSTFGKSALVKSVSEPSTINPQMALLKNSSLDPRFLSYLLCTKFIRAKIEVSNTGSGIPTMTQENINSFPVPLPDTDEVVRISDFLDYETTRIDRLIAQQQRLIELLKEKRQAVISHAVTKGLNPKAPMKDSGVEWLGQVPEHWGVSALGYYSMLNTGATPDRSKNQYWGGTIPWIKTGEVRYDTIYETEETITQAALSETSVRLSKPGTLLMAMYGQGITRGRVAILGVSATYNQACVAITPNSKVTNDFLKFFFMAGYDALRDGGNETSQMNLNADIVSKFKVLVPSYEEQIDIVSFLRIKLAHYEQLINKSEHAIALMQERRTALISAAVTGKIDLRGWTPPAEEAAA